MPSVSFKDFLTWKWWSLSVNYIYLNTQYNIIIEPDCMGISDEIKILMITIDAWVTILEIKAQSLYHSNQVWQC